MLILLIVDEEQNIIAMIYEKHYKRMLYTSTQILGQSRGEEALQDVFVALIEKYGTNIADLCDKPARFFVIVMRNHSINLLKKNRIEGIPLDDETVFTKNTLIDEIIAEDAEERLIQLIQSLNPVLRETLEYRFILNYSNQEIAELLDTTPTVISTRLERAKKALKRKLEESEMMEHE